MKTVNSLLALGVCLGLASCRNEAPSIPYGADLPSVWGKMLAPYGIYPLFPVRTNVQPGDIYILCNRPNPPLVAAAASTSALAASANGKGEWVHLFSLKDVGAAMEAYSKTRMAYQAFSVAAIPSASAPMSPASGALPYSIGSTGSTIGFASFPSVMSYTQNRSDFGVGTVVGVAAIGAGTSSASQGFYTLEIPSAEYAYLPHDALQAALAATAENPSISLRRLLLSIKAALASNDCVDGSLSVVGAVYYTRRITASMGDSQAAALSARAAYELPTGSTRDAVFKAIGSYAAGASAPAAPTSSALPSESARLAQLMIDIDKLYKSADDNSKLGFTGVKVGFAKSGGKGISMDYTYSVPVAFGMKLFAIGLTASGDEITLDPIISIQASRPASLTVVDTPLTGSLKLKPLLPTEPPASAPK